MGVTLTIAPTNGRWVLCGWDCVDDGSAQLSAHLHNDQCLADCSTTFGTHWGRRVRGSANPGWLVSDHQLLVVELRLKLAAGRPAPTSLRALLRCVVAAADGKKPMMSPPPPPPPVLLPPDEEAAAVQGARRSSCVAHERAQEASLVSGAWTPATRGAGRPVHQGAPGPSLAAPPLSTLPGRCQQGGPVVWIPSPGIVSNLRSFLAD